MSPQSTGTRAVRSALAFSGRTSRRGFWTWWLAVTAVTVLLAVAPAAAAGTLGPLDIRVGPLGSSLFAPLPLFATTGDGVADDPGWVAVLPPHGRGPPSSRCSPWRAAA